MYSDDVIIIGVPNSASASYQWPPNPTPVTFRVTRFSFLLGSGAVSNVRVSKIRDGVLFPYKDTGALTVGTILPLELTEFTLPEGMQFQFDFTGGAGPSSVTVTMQYDSDPDYYQE